MPAVLGVLARTAVRVIAGLALVAGGVLALTGGLAAWAVGGHRTAPDVAERTAGAAAEAAFTTNLAPVHTDGYAIVVPDVGAVLARHGVGRLLGDGRLTISVRSTSVLSTDLIVATLVPGSDATRYLLGTAHAEVLTVGYATGPQPVQSVDRAGVALARAAPWETPGTTGARDVTLGLDVPTAGPVALVVHRADGTPDLTVAIRVGFAPASWGAVTAVMSLGGVLATVTGLAVLLLRRPRLETVDDLLEDDDEPEEDLVQEVSPYVYTAT